MARPHWFNADFKSGLFFLGVGAFTVWRGIDYEVGTSTRMGPGYFPVALGILLFVLGSVIFGRSLKARGEEEHQAFELKSLVLVTASIVLFGATLLSFGLAVAIPILIVVSAAASDSFNITRVAILTIVMLIVCVAIFVWGLNLSIPVAPRSWLWS